MLLAQYRYQGTMYSKMDCNNRFPLAQKQIQGVEKAILSPWDEYLLCGANVLELAQITPSDSDSRGEDPRSTEELYFDLRVERVYCITPSESLGNVLHSCSNWAELLKSRIAKPDLKGSSTRFGNA